MLFKELTEEEDRELSKQDGFEQGIIRVAKNMKADGEKPDKIVKYTGLSMEEVEMI